MKITPELQEQLEKQFEGQICFFCSNAAAAVASIDVDPDLYNGKEGLAFPVCYRCLEDPESWNVEVVEMAALSEVHKYGWA